MSTESLVSSLSPKQMAFLPTEVDIAFYEEHGWYTTPPILSKAIIDTAIVGSQRYYAGERDFTLPHQTGFVDWKSEESTVLRNNEFVCLQNRELQQLGFESIIAAIAARLARTKQIRMFADSLLCKLPSQKQNRGVVGWHTDKSYWPTCSSNRLLTAWIPFQDCDKSLGPLVMIDRSHKWSESKNLKNFYENNLQELEAYMRSQGRDFVKVPMTLKKGQVSFHNCNTIHGSYLNSSNSKRLALAVHMQDYDNCYQEVLDCQGKPIHIGYDRLCRQLPNGNPDYSDPQFFPLLWTE
ncbi:phytanoyl-CoA dioxygenase family protein [Pleurocapsa sp. PCC 7319]|uniref:phytanoyl-CoA dioxygenase family protein n=1 Tax=Pleurocapsa sp. PCC 7319 TaxID=118161 RepID=UPI000349ADC4|nr:phytanoyl-CoA dioxygenase family protein [Pleurocapsa sp. PCC 7319]